MIRVPTIDVLLDADGDLNFVAGDFDFGQSEQQHINHILISHKGCWREHPVCGVSIAKWLNAPINGVEKDALKRKIRAQLEFDGLGQIRIDLDNMPHFELEAKRVK